ncbi:hypothetical protein EYF80_024804 [Liparis tanakae]|uniref:Uncharacterized protein n=1 Tax=Liparis tanakae TaxID=230148 RepID=A0A4Z2HHB6_9TELE|nr:hypothetical protein EYF80_024804 [Liparis tanakae]
MVSSTPEDTRHHFVTEQSPGVGFECVAVLHCCCLTVIFIDPIGSLDEEGLRGMVPSACMVAVAVVYGRLTRFLPCSSCNEERNA